MRLHFTRRRGASVLLGAGLAATALLGNATPALAGTLPAGQFAIAAGGSDTTQDFMEGYLAVHDNTQISDLATPATKYHVRTYNTRALTGFHPVTVDADAHCASITYTSAGTPTIGGSVSPNGSGNGRLAIINSRTNNDGCFDIGRSSSNPSAGVLPNGEYVAYAFDAVGWATASFKAPATLSRVQVQDIYKCAVTNWNQVGGSDGPIQRYIPQPGSGTRDFFLSAFGIAAGDLAITNGSCPLPVEVQENDGTKLNPAHRDRAILPYSAGKFSYQYGNLGNPTIDLTNGFRIGGVTLPSSARPSPLFWAAGSLNYILHSFGGGVVSEQNVSQANTSFSATNDFPGIRFVYNIIDPQNAKTYDQASALVGFDNSSGGNKSPLCNGEAEDLLLDNGFAPLDTGEVRAGSNAAGSTCRSFIVAP